MISYLEINDSYLIVKKEAHLPTAPLRPDDESLLSIVIKDFPDVACVEGKKNVEKGLIHRIDTETTGLVLVARNQQTYDFFQNEQKNNRIKKYYTAFCDVKNIPVNTQNGFPPFLKISALLFKNIISKNKSNVNCEIYKKQLKISSNLNNNFTI